MNKKKESKVVPNVRFKGFTDDWKQRKLGEVATFINGRAYSQDELQNSGKYKVLRVGNFYTNDSWYFSDMELDEKYYAKDGDLLYTWSATFGPHIWHGDKVIYHYHIWKVELSNILEKRFAVQLLEQDKDKILSDKNGSTMVHITKSGMEQKKALLPPNIKEQANIGEYFSSIDRFITLHQQKITLLTKLKKAMLEKMFPKKGAVIPEMRFNGFANAWEQRKFDEVFDCTIPSNTLSRAELNYESGSVRNIHYGDIIIKYGSVVDVKNDEIPFATGKSSEDFKSALLQDGDIIIADTAEDETTGKACEIGNSQGLDVVSGLHTMVCRPRNKMALGYLGYYLNSDAYHHQLLPLMQGIKVLSLSRTNVQKTMVCYPQSKAEQQLIADCFRNLDRLITLHQRKIDKLKNLKKAMLDQMLI